MPQQQRDDTRTRVRNSAPEPKLRICAVCGQVYDIRKFDEAFYHGQESHKPRADKTDAA